MKKPVLFIMVILLPLIASADKSGTCGSKLTWTYVESTKTLTVSGEGDMNSSNFALWGDISGDIVNVIVEDGVTSIGKNAFRSCKKIKTLELGNSVTLIGEKAFTDCSSLESVIIPNSVITIDVWAFQFCSSIKALIIGSGVTSIGRGAFKECTNIESLVIGECKATIGMEAFADCSSLTSLIIPNSVISIDNIAFKGCSSLTTVSIGNGVESIGDNAFEGCPDITNLSIGAGVKSIGEKAFANCCKISSVIIPDNTITIGNSAFANCTGMQTLTFGSNVFSIGDEAFYNCKNLSSVTIPSSMSSIGSRAFEYCSGMTTLKIENGITSIGDYTFSECNNLAKVNIPNSVTSIGKGAFSGCSGLTSIYISNNLKTIGSYCLSGCVSLKEIHLPDGIRKLQRGLFYGCTSLETIQMPIELDSIDNDVFRGCNSLSKIEIPETVSYIGGEGFGDHFGFTFMNCSSLETITIPDGVKLIPWCAFQGCTRLKKVEIGKGVAKLDRSAFGECNSLELIICNADEPPYVPDYYYNSQATNAFYKTNISQINLFVPQASKEFYKSQSPWSGFKSIRSIGAHFLTLGSYGNGKIKYMDKEVNYLYETIDVEPDEEVILELIPDEGHSVITIKVNDEEIMEPTTKYTINKLKEDTKIVAWFSPNWYKLTYMIDGEVYDEHIVLFGGAIEPIATPKKEGYSFSGWSDIPVTMPAHDITITGTFSINSYKLTYMIDNKVYKETMYEYGAIITQEPQPEGDYDTFEWTDLPQTMPAHDVVVYASYTLGIIEVPITTQRNICIYSPNGKKLDKLQKGLNIVVQDDGTVKKIVVK